MGRVILGWGRAGLRQAGGGSISGRSLEADSYAAGKRDAQDAIARGELALETFGDPGRCRYAQVLRETYRVSLLEVAGCVVDESIIRHARGFNDVMEAEVIRRHGADVFEVAGRKAGCT